MQQLRNFEIDIVYYELENNELVEKYIPFSKYENGSSTIFGSTNEQLSKESDGKATFSFDVELIYGEQFNPLVNLLVLERKIRLTTNKQTMFFVITSKKPSFKSNNVTFSFSCESEFVHRFSNQKILLDLSTDNENIWNEIGPKTVSQLVNKTFELANVYDWQINPILNIDIFQFPDNLYYDTSEMKVSLDVSQQTVYNILIEIATLFNAYIDIDYDNHYVDFINKEKRRSKGLRLKPETNLNEFSFNESSENSLYNIMYVNGGEDAEGNYISILPSIPRFVQDILISLDKKHNALTSPISNYNSKFHPFFYLVSDNGTYKLYVNGEENNSFTNWDWQSIDSIDALQKWAIDLYNLMVSESAEPSSTLTEINNYFYSLKKIPHAASFLYNFEYERNNGLLDTTRYNNLVGFLNKDLRNINLLIQSYNAVYSKYSYELNKKIDQEEELISLIAAEDESRANYNDINKTMTYYYQMQSEIVDGQYYLAIGTIKDDIVDYGRTENGYITYKLMDFDYITKLTNNYYCYNASGNLSLINETPEYDQEALTIKFTANIQNNTMIYIKYDEDELELEDNLSIDIDGIAEHTMYNYTTQLAQLWDETYQYYFKMIYGNNWLNKRIQEIEEKKLAKEKEHQELIRKMEQTFGSTWRNQETVDIIKTNMSKYVDYSTYLSQIQNLETYIGGTGSRKFNNSNEFYTFKGYYEYYLLFLNTYKTQNNIVSNSTNSNIFSNMCLTDILAVLNNEKKEWETSFYKNYKDIIKETSYSDENQLTADGLFNSAQRNFLTYNNPTQNFSSTVIDANFLEDFNNIATVGDFVEVNHPYLNEEEQENYFQVNLLNYRYADSHSIAVQYADKNGTHIQKVQATGQNNSILFFIDTPNTVVNIIAIIANGKKYGFEYNDTHRILSVQKAKIPQTIRLRITGIQQTLRSGTTKLVVEKRTLYNTIAGRLAYLLKNR